MFAFTHNDIDQRFITMAGRDGWDTTVSALKRASQSLLDVRPGGRLVLTECNYFKQSDVNAINMLDAVALLRSWKEVQP